ncbi:cell division protein FtsQ/DivIB [Geodermatophilus sp. URMC 64]
MNRAGTTTRDRARGTPAARPEASRGERPAPAVNRRRRVRSRRQRRLRALLLVPLLATAAWVLWASPLLAVRTVQVDGSVSLTAAEVRDAAGVTTGTPLLRVDVDAARTRVARLPQVAAVQVTRGWPSSVVITVTERVALAVVESDGQRYLVDDEAVLFDTITGDPPPGVVPLDVPDPGPGDRATEAGLAALASLPRDVRSDVVGASATSGEDVALTLTDGTTVLWGDGGDSAAKGAVLSALLDQLAAGILEPAATIDVSAPDAVVLR